MIQTVLNKILEKHKLWLEEEEEGEGERADLQRADLKWANLRDVDLRCADLQGADLQGASLQGAELKWVDLQGADLKWANLQGANLQGADLLGANLDYSAFQLWRGALNAKYDDKQVIWLLYHTLSAAQSEHVSEEVKKVLFSPEVVEIANRFHRVEECGEIGFKSHCSD